MGKIAIIARFPLSFLFLWAFSWSMANAETFPPYAFYPQDSEGRTFGTTGYSGYFMKKTALFRIEKHAIGNGRSFLSIGQNSLTGTGYTSNPTRIFLYSFGDNDISYNGTANKTYESNSNANATRYESSMNVFPGETNYQTIGPAPQVDNYLTVPDSETVTIESGKLKIGNYYFCLFGKYGSFGSTKSTTTDAELKIGDDLSTAIGYSDWSNLYPLLDPKIKSWQSETTTVPENPWMMSFYGYSVGTNGTTNANYDCTEWTYSTELQTPPVGIDTNYQFLIQFLDADPTEARDDAFSVCNTYAHNVQWQKSVSDWGELESFSSLSGSSGGGYWDGFMRMFSSSDAYKETKYTNLQYGSGARFDRIDFANSEELTLGDPYSGTAITNVKGGTVDVYSYSGGVAQVINGIEIVTQGLYAEGVYAGVEFLNAKGEVSYFSPLIPETLTGGTRLVAYVPVYKTLAPIRARLTRIQNVSFLSITPMMATATESKNVCRDNAVNCAWRATDARPPLSCVNMRNFDIDPFDADSLTGSLSFCEVRAGACRPTVATGTYLGAEGVKTSLLIGGNGSYFVDASGSLQFDATKQTIGGVTGTDSAFVCDTSGLSWYQYAPKYFDCVWAFILNTSDEGINKPMQIGTQISDKASQAGTGSTSIRNWVDSTPDTVETNAVLAPFRDSKSLSDAGYGWGRLVVWVVAFVMLMVLIGLFFAFTSRPGKN